jgi:hypothetical protein
VVLGRLERLQVRAKATEIERGADHAPRGIERTAQREAPDQVPVGIEYIDGSVTVPLRKFVA